MRSALASAVALYVATALAAWALLRGLGDQHWIAAPLLFGPRWLLLLPLAVLAPLAALRRRRLLLPLALAAGVVLGPVMGGEVGWRRLRPMPEGTPFRVVTYNVGSAEDGAKGIAAALPRLLAAWQPDVIAFQECGYYLGRRMARLEGWAGDVRGELCLLSRHPIADTASMDRVPLRRDWYLRHGILGGGQADRYTLATPRGPVTVTHVHLETPREGVDGPSRALPHELRRNIALRDRESRAARALVDDGTRRIVLGDFNMPRESRIFRRHWGDLTDAFPAAGAGWGATRYAGWVRARIDHVLVDESWRVRAVRVANPFGLDHGAVIVDLVLPDA